MSNGLTMVPHSLTRLRCKTTKCVADRGTEVRAFFECRGNSLGKRSAKKNKMSSNFFKEEIYLVRKVIDWIAKVLRVPQW